jgi:hypothetical protein
MSIRRPIGKVEGRIPHTHAHTHTHTHRAADDGVVVVDHLLERAHRQGAAAEVLHLMASRCLMHTHTHTHAHAHAHTHTRTKDQEVFGRLAAEDGCGLIGVWAHAHTRAYIHTCIHTSIHVYIHPYMYTYIHTYIQTYIHTYIQTLALSSWSFSSWGLKTSWLRMNSSYTHTYTHEHTHTRTHRRTHMHAHKRVVGGLC